MHPYHPSRHYTEPRRWQPLSDAEWDALLPYVLVQNGPGRPLRDARARMDAIFWTAASGSAWRTLPPTFGRPDSVSRHFRRLAHAGLWERLLRALARPDAPPALLALEHWIVRACRRATRLRGLRIIALARRLGFLSALRAPSWLLPDPDLSETVQRAIQKLFARMREAPRSVHWTEIIPPSVNPDPLPEAARALLWSAFHSSAAGSNGSEPKRGGITPLRRLLGACAGRRRIPRCLEPA